MKEEATEGTEETEEIEEIEEIEGTERTEEETERTAGIEAIGKTAEEIDSAGIETEAIGVIAIGREITEEETVTVATDTKSQSVPQARRRRRKKLITDLFAKIDNFINKKYSIIQTHGQYPNLSINKE